MNWARTLFATILHEQPLGCKTRPLLDADGAVPTRQIRRINQVPPSHPSLLPCHAFSKHGHGNSSVCYDMADWLGIPPDPLTRLCRAHAKRILLRTQAASRDYDEDMSVYSKRVLIYNAQSSNDVLHELTRKHGLAGDDRKRRACVSDAAERGGGGSH
eukprot:6204141-Pleurochrysis_carterae.AAC.1